MRLTPAPATRIREPKTSLGRRIAIYGNSGSGKSTLGAQLGETLGLPWVELDAVFHARPNWDDLSTEDFRAAVIELLATHSDGWVMDGNYGTVRDLILAQADTAIWLKLPFLTVYRRLAWRTISRAAVNAPLWNGNRESWRQTLLSKDSMLWWGIHSWRPSRQNTAAALAKSLSTVRIMELHTPRQVAALVRAAQQQAALALSNSH
jgi:adenylate kinase family enzyme